MYKLLPKLANGRTPEAIAIEGLLRISPKEPGPDVNFILNKAQRLFDTNLAIRNDIVKARQEGFSSMILARFTILCLGVTNTRAVVISHEREATERLLARVHGYLETFRGPKAKTRYANRNEITFPKTNASIFIGTAGSRKFGRGDTITHLHCSEIAFWENPKDLMAGLLQAVPKTGEVYRESTSNGAGTWWHRQTKRSQAGLGRFRFHFFPWHTFPEYSEDLTHEESVYVVESLDDEIEEPALLWSGKLTAGQILWRRLKIYDEFDGDLDLFKQEYPMTPEESFKVSGLSFFNKVHFDSAALWKQRGPGEWIRDGHPREGYHYSMGVDVAAGLRQDKSVIEIICAETDEQVGEFVSDRIDPAAFGHKIARLGKEFNFAFIVIESNNHGLATITAIKEGDLYPAFRMFRDKKFDNNLARLGFRTTERSKYLLLGNFRRALKETVVLCSPYLQSELQTFVSDEVGKLRAQEGCHDDAVMACALAVWGLRHVYLEVESDRKIALQANEKNDPFRLDGILDELARPGGDLVLPGQGISEIGPEELDYASVMPFNIG